MTSQPTPTVLPQGTRIGRTALRVNNLETVAQFYRDVVGLTVLNQTDRRSILGAGDEPLLILEGDAELPERPKTSAGLFHTAIRVPSRPALGDALIRLRNQWHLSGASDHWVSEALYTRDPEDNGVEIYRDRPREEWPLADDGRVEIGTVSLDLDRIEAVGTDNDRVPAETDIGHIHLEVSSLSAFTDCYVETLGFEVQTEFPQASFVSAGGYHHHLGANTWQNRTSPISGRGLAWFEIVVPDASTLEALRKRVAASPFSMMETEEGITITDADGIAIRVGVST